MTARRWNAPRLLVATVAILAVVHVPAATTEQSPPRRSWLGVSLMPVESNPDDAHGETSGVIVSAVVRDSPADQAGLRGGDVLRRVAGHDVRTPDDVIQSVRRQASGAWIEVELSRHGREKTLDVRVASSPDDPARMSDIRRPWSGVTPIDVPLQLRTFWGGDEERGVLVGEVVPNGPAQRGGLQVGDLVLSIDGKNVATASDLTRRIQLGGVGNTVTFELSRQGTRLAVEVTLEDQPARPRTSEGRG